ncbi:hypothetical protein [Derxia lacustris]|nr:hypothetical protein [Derxia lacustris]
MSEDAVRAAIAVVAAIDDDAIRATVRDAGGSAALAEKLVARKADMARRL